MPDKELLNRLKKILFHYLDPKKYKVFIFGSRADGRAAKFSDIDIGIEGAEPIPKAEIEEAFENSDLPYLVEIVNFNHLSEKFKKVAYRKTIYI